MRQSVFNHMVRLLDGSFVVCNFFTGKFVHLNLLTKDAYDHPEFYGPEYPVVKTLLSAGALVDYDERAYLEALVRTECGRNSDITLLICPTMMCNFACPYCYETARPGKMSQETQRDVLRFVEGSISANHASRLHIVWYGGEPLLEKKIIRDLSMEMIRICEEKHVIYTSSIITNGYFLTEDAVALFDECRIRRMQITLDGPDAATHDHTRHLLSGGGTFERIMNNIRAWRGDCEINIRCNVQKENADKYQTLKKVIEQVREKTGLNIQTYIGHMQGQKSYTDLELDGETDLKLRNQELTSVPRLSYMGPVCMMPKLTHYVIDELGYLYKCFDHVGDDRYPVGHVRDFDPYQPKQSCPGRLLDCFSAAWPDEDDECMSCPLLPVCLGGCPHRRRTAGKECHPVKYALDEYVTEAWEELKNCEKSGNAGSSGAEKQSGR